MPIYEKKAKKLRVRKTPAAKRTTYTYPIYDGSTITLIPGKDGITAHPGEKAPRNWNLSIDYVMSDDEHDSEKAAIENIPDGSEVSPEVEMLRAAVETMSERQKQVYELHYLRGFNVKETAAILGMSSPTVTAHKKRIMEIIKKFFEGTNFSG